MVWERGLKKQKRLNAERLKLCGVSTGGNLLHSFILCVLPSLEGWSIHLAFILERFYSFCSYLSKENVWSRCEVFGTHSRARRLFIAHKNIESESDWSHNNNKRLDNNYEFLFDESIFESIINQWVADEGKKLLLCPNVWRLKSSFFWRVNFCKQNQQLAFHLQISLLVPTRSHCCDNDIGNDHFKRG